MNSSGYFGPTERQLADQPIYPPFALTYGMEAIVTIEIGMPTLRTDIPEQSNTKSVIKDLDMVDKLHEAVAVRIALYHRRLENLYNRRVKPRMFQLGDLVLRKVFGEHN